MKCLLICLIALSGCTAEDSWSKEMNQKLSRTSRTLDTITIRATDQLRRLREMNHWLRLAGVHSKKEVYYVEKYYKTYDEKYFNLYKLHNDSCRYYLTKTVNVK